ncbi:helix-turn-helix transcriptional regulator [Pelagibius marinus]|uniref:helix-turn-helix transcriptional regulator n=1 Tax=Pelagibius marinus TaxID=2762760 RepID=UPI0018732198|nr:LuxR C-terminal-related transcriptional regulator [Pelagibius marinus]
MNDSHVRDSQEEAAPRQRRCAVVAAGIEPGPLLDALRSVPNTRVGDICIFPSNGRGEPEADYLILAANDGSRFHGLEDQIGRWSGQRTRVLLAVPESKCAMLGELPERADGLILLDRGLNYLEESLKLAEDGYSVMPAAGSGSSDNSVYLEMLARLSDGEKAILALLAEGDSNRSIAEALEESEARVKSMVRAILIKLDCRNRTEAAVLAATVLLPLLESLQQDGARSVKDKGNGKDHDGGVWD